MTNTDMVALDAFEKGKMRVLDFARELKAVATDRKDSETAKTLDKLLNRFEETRFLVLAIGEFKRGKSTMINALAGREICPTGVLPKTARITRIFGSALEREYVEIHFAGEERDPETIPLDGAVIGDLVAMSGKKHKEVAHVDVYLKASGPLLQSGVVLVDTPGLKSVIQEHDEVAKNYLPRADLVIFSLSAIQPMSAEEKGFLIARPELLDKTIFVLNRMDEVPENERQEVIDFVRAALREHVFGKKDAAPRLVPISALQASKVRKGDSIEELAQTGVPGLAAMIVASLVKERGYPVLKAIAEGERDVAAGLVRQITAVREVRATAITPDLDARCGQLLVRLRRQSAALDGALTNQIDARARSVATNALTHVQGWREALKAELHARLFAYQTEGDCQQNLPNELAYVVQGHLNACATRLKNTFTEMTQNATATCRSGFNEMEQDAVRTLAADRALPALAHIASGLEALADLGALAGCLGGPIGGHGVVSAAMQPAFHVPAGLRLLTVGAGIVSVLAAVGGPVGWTAAVVSWLVAGITNLLYANAWRDRVTAELEKAIDVEIIPRAEQAVTNDVWTFAQGLQEHVTANIRGVLFRLEEAVGALRRQVEANNVAAQRELRGLEDAEKRLVGLGDELAQFLTALPIAEAQVSTAEEKKS